MKLKFVYFYLMIQLFLISQVVADKLASESVLKPPVLEKIKKELTLHDHTRVDHYYWLNNRENPKVLEYLKAENDYTHAVIKPAEKLQEKLYQEIIKRIKQTDISVPYQLRGYYYYTRYEEGKEYPIYCRKKGNMAEQEEIMLNVNEMAKEHSFYEVAGLNISSNNNILAFGVDTVGRRQYAILFKDLVSGKMLPDTILNTTGNVAWANDNEHIYYNIKDETLRPYKIYRHKLGTSEDQEIFHETDETFYAYVHKSKSERFILIGCYSTLSNEYHFLDADHPEGEFKVLHPRERDLEYTVDHYQDKFYILTNYQAKNFRLMETAIAKTTKENWREVIAHRSDVLLENLEIFDKYLVVEERKNGLTQLRVKNWTGDQDYYLDFGEPTYTAYIGTNVEFHTELLRFGYSSLTTPTSVFDFHLKTKEKTLLKQQEVVGGFDPTQYQAERLYAKASDSTSIPISLVYKKSLKKDTGNPLMLYGYGSYGASMDAYFSSVRLSLLDRGFIYAIAHIRGGQEMGRHWYEDGKLLKKKNTFTDFITCTQHLIQHKYTSQDQLFAEGASAGGLLIGAVINMAPELFKGVIADVPFVDVLTTMLDESIPLTTGEYDEWGNPNEEKYYHYMLSYSPYDNVEAKAYPAIFVSSGLHDSQVQYWESAKWVAKLRSLKTDNNLLLLYTDMEAGHGGASGRFQQYKLTAMEYTFILSIAGIKE